MEDIDKNPDLFIRKVDEESNNSQKALAEVTKNKIQNESAASNNLVSGVDALLKQYYKDAEGSLAGYSQYISYEAMELKTSNEMEQEVKKLEAVFKNAQNLDDAINMLNALIKATEASWDKMKSMAPPSGMEDIQSKKIAFLEKYIQIVKDMSAAIAAKDLAKVEKSLQDMKDFIADTKPVEEITQLEKYYFNGLHKKFTDLRQEADNIKTELIKNSSELNIPLDSISIEGW